MTIDSPGVKRSLPRPRCSCIIPFHNEQDRILRVLNVATRLNNLTQVICVDDGSTDDTSRQIVLRYPGVTLLRVPVKGGKAAAVRAGIDLVHTSHVLLLDADLRGLEAGEIGLAVSTALAHPEIDMIILRRVKAAIHARLSLSLIHIWCRSIAVWARMPSCWSRWTTRCGQPRTSMPIWSRPKKAT